MSGLFLKGPTQPWPYLLVDARFLMVVAALALLVIVAGADAGERVELAVRATVAGVVGVMVASWCATRLTGHYVQVAAATEDVAPSLLLGFLLGMVGFAGYGEGREDG